MLTDKRLGRYRMQVFAGFINTAPYRRSQGRLVRCLVFVVLLMSMLMLCRQLHVLALHFFGPILTSVLTGTVGAALAWAAWRLVQYPSVADFLIDVQIESSKVSWCGWVDLCRIVGVVLAAMGLMSIYLFVCDVTWQFLLRGLSVLNL